MKRIVVLFIVAQLLLIAVFYLILNSDLDFDLIKRGRDITIEIIGSNRPSGKLQFSDPGIIEVTAGKKVIWKIRDGEGAKDVQWFDIEPKGDQPMVFLCDPPRGNRRRPAVGYLRNRATPVDFEYEIFWRDRDGNDRRHDPKIAIRPGTKILDLLIYILYPLLAGIISYMTFRKQRSSETRPT